MHSSFCANIDSGGNCIGGLESVVFEDGVDFYTNGVYCFYNHVFWGCSNLSLVKLPNGTPDRFIIPMGTFGYCGNLKSIEFPTNTGKIEQMAFYRSGLESLDLTKIELKEPFYLQGYYTFAACENLKTVTAKGKVRFDGLYTFQECSGLTMVTIPNSVTNIGTDAFEGCYNIKTLSINTQIDPHIPGCEELYIGDDVTTVYDYYNYYYRLQLRKVVLGKKVSQIRAQAFSNANIQEFTITGEEPPYCYPNIFGTQDLSAATLYVPASKAEYYQTTEPWTEFGIVKTLEGETPVMPTACEKPAIAFENGKLLFTCGTNGAEYHCTITSPDMKNNELNEIGVVDLQACYDIYVYATADGCTQSETATAKLYWVKDDGSLSGINQVERRGIVVSSDNGFVNVSGLNDGEHVTFYSTEGKLLGTQTAQGGACVFTTFEKVAIVKIGDSSFKVLVK